MESTSLQVPGLIRRARRETDLSQRDLAAVLGVDQSVVARWETGAVSPAVPMLERVLALGGFRLVVLVGPADGAGSPAQADDEAAGAAEARPMRPDGVRDRQRRRFPSHLDVRDRVDSLTGDAHPHAPLRRRRDRIRARTGMVPADHPSFDEMRTARSEATRRRREGLAERVRDVRARRLPEWVPLPWPEPCTCPAACWLEPRCQPGCACGCEGREPMELARSTGGLRTGGGATMALL